MTGPNTNPAEPSTEPADTITMPSMAEFEAAFPGQAVDANGRPNAMRRAMLNAVGLVRAVARGDILLAGAWMRVYRGPLPPPPVRRRRT